MTTEYTKQDEPGRRCNADRRPASSINSSLLSGGSLADYDYWPTNRVQTITHTDSAAAILSRYSYQYDQNGNRTQQIEEQGTGSEQVPVPETTDYTYDTLDRLESFTVTDGATTSTTDYTFEGYNRKTEQVTVDSVLAVDKTYSYDETNWLEDVTDAVSGAVISYSYDNNGNTTLKADSSQPGQEMVFDYDVANRLVQTEQGATLLGQYDYNASGMRVRHYGSERGDVEYYYDDGAVLEEYVAGAGGGLLAHYRYGDRLLSLDTGAETQYYHHDALGSTVNLTDGAGLTKVRYTLDPWGHIRGQVGTSVNRQIFTGQEHDENTGLIYFGARYYDPDTARFISQDSYLGEAGAPPSLHRYLYAYSNPTVYLDLDGHSALNALVEQGDEFENDRQLMLDEIQKARDADMNAGNTAMGFKYSAESTLLGMYGLALKGATESLRAADFLIDLGRMNEATENTEAGQRTIERIKIIEETVSNASTGIKQLAKRTVEDPSGTYNEVALAIGDKAIEHLEDAYIKGNAQATATNAEILTGMIAIEAFAGKSSSINKTIDVETSVNAIGPARIDGLLPGTLDDVSTRKWYHKQLDSIPEQINRSQSVHKQARQAFDLRNKARVDARALMVNRKKALDYDVTDPIRTWQEQIKHSYDKGNRGNAIWEDILETSTRSRASVDKAAGLAR